MNTKKQWLQAFVSLTWYETLLRFIATFIAKTSELLLAAGLVVSSANFLTDGDVLGTATFASRAWAWTQALAIDSSLAISFYYVLQCFKQRDWTKFVLYSVLTLLLALVAGTITNIDIYSHAIHASIANAMRQIGVNVGLLSTLRAVAVVGFVLMSRLRDVSLKELYIPDETELSQEQASSQEPSHGSHQTTSANQGANRLTVDEFMVLVNAFSQRGVTTIKEVSEEPGTLRSASSGGRNELRDVHKRPRKVIAQRSFHTDTSVESVPRQPVPSPVSSGETSFDTGTAAMQTKAALPEELRQGKRNVAERQSDEQAQPIANFPRHFDEARVQKLPAPASRNVPIQPSNGAQQGEPSQEARLEQAYQELKAEGKKPSGRALAERAHIHRSTCNAWLKAHTSRKSLTDQVVPQDFTNHQQ